jgi:hypothetical protein
VVEVPVPVSVGRDVGALERVLEQIVDLLQTQRRSMPSIGRRGPAAQSEQATPSRATWTRGCAQLTVSLKGPSRVRSLI